IRSMPSGALVAASRPIAEIFPSMTRISATASNRFPGSITRPPVSSSVFTRASLRPCPINARLHWDREGANVVIPAHKLWALYLIYRQLLVGHIVGCRFKHTVGWE